MDPEEMKLPKMSNEAFELSEPYYWWRQSVPPNPIFLQRVLEKEEMRAVVATYVRAQAAAAQAYAQMYSDIANIVSGKTRG